MVDKYNVLLAYAFAGWALCGATIALGMKITSLENALIIHAIFAPIIFVILSFFYFKNFRFASPVFTAIIFTSFVIFMDFFVIALVIERSLEMFKSFLGTWLPFLLIFLSTYLTGIISTRTLQKNKTPRFA